MNYFINTHFGVKGLSASDQAVCDAMRFAFNRLNLKLEPSGAVALACLLENKEKFRQEKFFIINDHYPVELPVLRLFVLTFKLIYQFYYRDIFLLLIVCIIPLEVLNVFR